MSGERLDVLQRLERLLTDPEVRARLEHEHVHPLFLDHLTTLVMDLLEDGAVPLDVPLGQPAVFLGVVEAVLDHLAAWGRDVDELRDGAVGFGGEWLRSVAPGRSVRSERAAAAEPV